MRLNELKNFLFERDYPERLVNSAIEKARAVPREKALRRMIRKKQKEQKIPIFSIKYDPRLPSISNLQAKHWRSMTFQDQYMKEVFPEPPLTAYRRQKNLKYLLIRARVPPPLRAHSQRKKRGMSKCGLNCTACPYIKQGSKIKISQNT